MSCWSWGTSRPAYAAYVWDPDGNNIEAVFHGPEPLTDVAPTRRPEEARNTPGVTSG